MGDQKTMSGKIKALVRLVIRGVTKEDTMIRGKSAGQAYGERGRKIRVACTCRHKDGRRMEGCQRE